MNDAEGVGRRLWLLARNVVSFFVLWALLYTPFVLWLDPASAASDGSLPASMRLWLEFFGAGSIVLAAWIVVRFLDGRPFHSLGFHLEHMPRELGAGLFIGAGMVAVAVVPAWALGWAHWRVPEGFSWSILATLAGAMLFNTVIQEVMTRGYVLQTIESAFGTIAALLVSTLFFTALHAAAILEGGVLPAVNLVAAGLLLGDEAWNEVHAGWLNVLFPLKAWVGFGVDLRNHDDERLWDDGYADQ